MYKEILKGFTDSNKRFEERVLHATQSIEYCLNQWFLDLSKALQPLLVHNDIKKAFETYSSFLYDQSKYQIPVHQALALVHEAESRLKDTETRLATIEIRLGTILVFRWLDDQTRSFPINPCFSLRHTAHEYDDKKYRFGEKINGTWALLKSGNEFLFEEAITLEVFLKSNRKIILSDGPAISIDELCLFLKNQMDAINTLIIEIAHRIGIVNARVDFLKNIDLKSPKFDVFFYDNFSNSLDLSSCNNKIVKLYRMFKSLWDIDLDNESKFMLTKFMK